MHYAKVDGIVEKDTSNAYPDYDLHACVGLKDKKNYLKSFKEEKGQRGREQKVNVCMTYCFCQNMHLFTKMSQ